MMALKLLKIFIFILLIMLTFIITNLFINISTLNGIITIGIYTITFFNVDLMLLSLKIVSSIGLLTLLVGLINIFIREK